MKILKREGDAATELRSFFDFIYDKVEGIAYVAFKHPQTLEWKQLFFNWPIDASELVSAVLQKTSELEVYFSPALFKEQDEKVIAKKPWVMGSHVLWAEFDNCSGIDLGILPPPSLKLQSSSVEHQHWYWKLEDFLKDIDLLEKINRSIAYSLGADPSGWDCTQVLRPPNTLNHKRSLSTRLIEKTDTIVVPEEFNALPEPPPSVIIPFPERIPQVEDVIAKYPIPIRVWRLFKRGMPEGKRSDGLMALGYSLAELQFKDEEIISVLLNADERWGKFKERDDRLTRLTEIITRARIKYPVKDKQEPTREKLKSLTPSATLSASVELAWVLEGLLHEQGYLLLTGHSGVGKSQFSLDAACHIALGKDFLNKKVQQKKIGFFSLEMGIVELKHFLKHQISYYTEEELAILDQNLRIYPIGEPIYLNRSEEKSRIEEAIHEEGLQGILIDSLGSTTEESLSAEKDIKNLMDWNDRLRNDYKIFSWYIHHHRKATADNKRPNKLSDVYGSQYITARATSVLCLWDAGIINSLQVIPLKVRLSPEKDTFNIYRDAKLHFTLKKSGITVVDSRESPNEVSKQPLSDIEIKTDSGFNI